MRSDQELIVRAAAVATRAPQEWVQFVAAMKDFADDGARTVVMATPDVLQRMQGRAQQCAELSSLLKDAVKTADSIAARKAGSTAANHRSIP